MLQFGMMTNQDELTKHLQESAVLHSKALTKAFLSIDRKDFVRPEYISEAYGDYPLPIGYGQTISQPYTVVFMLEALQISPEDSVLDIGAGSGWTTALMATIARQVVGVERIPELVAFAKENLAKYHFTNATIFKAGSELGIPNATFDKILVSAAALSFPDALLSQLNPGGKIVIPVQNSILLIDKEDEGNISRHTFDGFVFVPLVV